MNNKKNLEYTILSIVVYYLISIYHHLYFINSINIFILSYILYICNAVDDDDFVDDDDVVDDVDDDEVHDDNNDDVDDNDSMMMILMMMILMMMMLLKLFSSWF